MLKKSKWARRNIEHVLNTCGDMAPRIFGRGTGTSQPVDDLINGTEDILTHLYSVGGNRKPLGRGSTANPQRGTTLPRNLKEQLAVESAMSNPEKGLELMIDIKDARWPKSQGWVKKYQNFDTGNGTIQVHYNYNKVTKAIDDFKVVIPRE